VTEVAVKGALERLILLVPEKEAVKAVAPALSMPREAFEQKQMLPRRQVVCDHSNGFLS
jgi:hypothetical protein